ncbi:hypothetical protein OROMI_022583 [Orobanche minor]
MVLHNGAPLELHNGAPLELHRIIRGWTEAKDSTSSSRGQARVGTAFASGLIQAIQFLQLNWRQLARDILLGSLNSRIVDTSVRECMIQVMRPDPELADLVAQECGKDSWEGIIIRIWPNTKYLDTIITGSMAPYASTLDLYSGGLPIASTRYGSSECFIGINLNPMCKPSQVCYTIMPNMAYFEFLPSEPNSHESLVDLVDVEVGKEYELVVTTFAGLYRYLVGDILRVTGFHNSAPQFQFIRKKNAILSIDAEKTNEVELQAAVETASHLLGELETSVVEYTSYADTTKFPGHYVIYWELRGQNLICNEVLDQCCLAMEESFNSIYRELRVKDQSIGPLEIRVVKNGTFKELMELAIGKDASIAQYKLPRCIASPAMMSLLNLSVESVHFSPSLPYWTTHELRAP